jgi:SAM-dependent methyltransferase
LRGDTVSKCSKIKPKSWKSKTDPTSGRIKIEKESETKATKLHLGCGNKYIPGFVHVDLADFPHIDHKREISDLSIFANESVELIYCSHALEYFDRLEATNVLKEWRRVLKENGVLRVAVPDIEALVEVYRSRKDLNVIHGPLYGRIVVVTPCGKKTLYHKTAYDFQSLKILLQECGFVDIHRYEWRNTEHRYYDDYSQAYIPHMDKEHGKLISLNVEAKKPRKE